jgi:predicted transcriptional regulator
MAIDVSKHLEERFRKELQRGDYSSADELFEKLLSSLEVDKAFRLAVDEGAAEADRGELIPGDEVIAEIDALIAEVESRAQNNR